MSLMKNEKASSQDHYDDFFAPWIWRWMLQHNPGLSSIPKSSVSPAEPPDIPVHGLGLWAWLAPAQAGVEVPAEGGRCSLFTAQHLRESGTSWRWERVWIALPGKVWVAEVSSVWVVGRLRN